MGTKQKILLGHFIEGKPIRQLARELGLHRKTVTKYITEHKASLAPGAEPIAAAGMNSPTTDYIRSQENGTGRT